MTSPEKFEMAIRNALGVRFTLYRPSTIVTNAGGILLAIRARFLSST